MRVNRTFSLSIEAVKKIEKEAKKQGLSKSAYIGSLVMADPPGKKG